MHKPVVYQEQSTVDSSQFTVQNVKRILRDNPKSKIQNRKYLEGRYVLAASNQVRFALGPYDKTKPLVIDPVLSYSTYLGGSLQDASLGIAVDSSGNAYVTGYTQSSDFPTLNPVQSTYHGGEPAGGLNSLVPGGDVFITKLNADGSALVYSTYLGGSGSDQGNAIAVDSSGFAYVTGSTSSTDFPTLNPIQSTYHGGGSGSFGPPGGDAFITKLSADGSALIYSTYLGGSAQDEGNGIAVDSSGNSYVTGQTISADFPTANAIQAACDLGSSCSYGDAFVTKVNAAGSALVYSTYLGGSNSDTGNGVAVDSSRNAYVTGQTYSSDFPTVNPLQANNSGAPDAFVAKLNSAGSALVYSTYLGGSGSEQGTSIAVDSAGNAYITGNTQSSDFPTASPLQAASGGDANDAFVAKINAAGSALVYSTYLGGSSTDDGLGIAVDTSGNAYVTGFTRSPDFPTASPVQASINTYLYDAFVTKINAAGSALLYSTFLGGSNINQGNGIAADSAGNAYLTGQTESSDFPITAGAFQPALAGTQLCGPGGLTDYPCPDAFVVKLSPSSYANLSGGSLSFGSVLVNGTSSKQTLALTAGGDAAFNLTSIIVDGDFALVTTGTSCPYSGGPLAFQVQCTIDVTFTPTATGSRTGTVTLNDNAPGSPQSIALTGAGIVSAPTVSPGGLTFNSQLVGTSSASQPVTITNNSSAAMAITSLAVSSGWTETDNCLPSIAASSSCMVNVSFLPSTSGPVSGALTLTDFATNSPQTVSLSGTGLAPAVSFSPTSLTFASRLISTTSASQSVTLTNTGTGDLMISGIPISGDFAQTNNCPRMIAPSGSCSINATFTPTDIGTRPGEIGVYDNATPNPQAIMLSGTGYQITASLSATSLPFSGQPVGTKSAAQSVTLQNNGNQPLSITSIGRGGGNRSDFGLTQTCGASLAAGATCVINVTFTPAARGISAATISLVDNAANSPQTIALTGTGTSPSADLSSSSLTFPSQFVGTTGLPQNIRLTNNGNAALTISSVQASAQFGVTNGCTSSLAAGVACTLSVFFDPSSSGTQTGTLTPIDSAAGSPQTVQLSGAGMDFGMSSTATTASISPGGTATYALSVAPLGGLNQTVSLVCGGAPSLSTCTVSPSSVTLNGTATVPVSISVSTTAGAIGLPMGKVLPPCVTGFGRMVGLLALMMLASLVALAWTGKRRPAYLLGLSLIMMMLWSACGGGGSMGQLVGTPAGTYALSVTGTVNGASSTKLTHSVNLSLTVK